MRHIREALEMDPLAVSFNRSFEVIVQHLRAELLRPDRAIDDPTTPLLYRALGKAGATADEAVHLVHARYLLATGDQAQAERLAEAVTILFPASPAAWAFRAEIAAAMGDSDTAAIAGAEAAALGGHAVPFVVQVQARG